MQNRSNTQPTSSDVSLAATLPVGELPAEKLSAEKPNWKRTGALTGVAVASAGIVLPLAREQAIAYKAQSPPDTVQPKNAARQAQSEPLKGALKPQTSQTAQASFSSQTASQVSTESSPSIDRSSDAAPLLARAQDGSIRLSYQPSTAAGGEQTQAVLTQLVAETQAQSNLAQASDPQTKGQADIPAKLPEAQQEVQRLRQKIADFEAERGQKDMQAYQKVLASRMSEIAEQKTRLEANIERNQRILTQLKVRLLTVDADLSLANHVLAADTEYQAVWARLQKSEQNLLEEFSSANIDATRLNEIYADYKYHQQWLSQVAEQVFPGYVMSDETAKPSFISQAPAAIDIMQNLVLATHQDQVQRLRQSTIDGIEGRLQARHDHLLTDIGIYEQMQRELSTAEQQVAQYEQGEQGEQAAAPSAGKAQLVADTTTREGRSPQPSSAVSQAAQLAPYFPNGTVSKTLLGIVVAAGAIATALVQHRSHRRKPFDKSAGTIDSFAIAPESLSGQPSASTPATLNLYGETGETTSARTAQDEDLIATVLSAVEVEEVEPISIDKLVAELLEITRDEQRPTPSLLETEQTEEEPTEDVLLAELMDVIERPSPNPNGKGQAEMEVMTPPVLSTEVVEKILGVEVMAKELDDILRASETAPAPLLSPSMLPEVASVRTASSEPVKLSVREIDLFAEQVIQWVLNDLGLKVVKPARVAVDV